MQSPQHREFRSEFARKHTAVGKAELVLRLLERRFGPLPESAVARVPGAGVEELDAFGDRVLTAERLEDVIG